MTREQDAHVAEKVMGWELSTNGEVWVDKVSGECFRDVDDWFPSAPDGIADAWRVVEKMDLSVVYDHIRQQWFTGKMEWQESEGWQFEGTQEIALTAPEAICEAALKVVDG